MLGFDCETIIGLLETGLVAGGCEEALVPRQPKKCAIERPIDRPVT